MQIQASQLKNLLTGIASIFTIYCLSSILQQSLLTLPYRNSLTGEEEKLPDQAILIFLCDLVAWGAAWGYNWVGRVGRVGLPVRDVVLSGAVKFVGLITYSWAIPLTNYPVVMAFKSCNLLSVILVAILCTRVKDKNLKLGPKKLIVGLVISIGIFIFSFFDPQKQKRETQSQILGIVLLFISMFADGWLPDLQAHLKSQYKPQPTQMMQQINKWVTLITLASMVVSSTFLPSVKFIWYHPKFAAHAILMAFLATLGQFVIYRMIKQFKQHIVPFVITTRKILTIVISIVVLNHETNIFQIIAIIVVFSAVCFEFYSELKDDKRKAEQNFQKITTPCQETKFQRNMSNEQQFQLDIPNNVYKLEQKKNGIYQVRAQKKKDYI